MTKKELKQILLLYTQVEKALLRKMETVEIKKNRRKERITIKSWMYKLPEIIGLIEENENDAIVKTIIKMNIRKRENDKRVLQNIAVSESTYYRLKRQIVEKIYNMYVILGEVKLKEILSEQIY